MAFSRMVRAAVPSGLEEVGILVKGRTRTVREGLLTQPQAVSDERKVDERGEHGVKLLEAREDSSIAFASAKLALDVDTKPVYRSVVFPGPDTSAHRRHDRDKAQVACNLARFAAFVGAIHEQMHGSARCANALDQFTAFGRVLRLTWPQREGYGRARVRGKEVDVGVPSATGIADSLRTVLCRAPVPSRCNLTLVLSKDTASILVRTTAARCSCSKALSSTPDLAQRLMRGVDRVPAAESLGRPRQL